MDAAALVVGTVVPDRLLYGGDNLFRQFTKEVGGIDLRIKISQVDNSVSHSYKISDSAWQYDSGSSHKYGNRAIGNGKFIRKILFVTVETRECEVTLTCDNNGNLS